MRHGPDLVSFLADTWSSIAAVVRDLDEQAWHTPSPLPGWTVKDCVSHITGVEASLSGRPDPPPERPVDHPWLRNDLARAVEVAVERRRPWPPEQVLAEFEAVTADRLAALRRLGPADFAAESWTPVGPGTVERLLEFRVLDSYVHEHDIRVALGLPWRLDAPATDHVWTMTTATWPRQVARVAGAPDGTVVVIQTSGPLQRAVAVVVTDGRGRLAAVEEAGPPTVRLTGDAAALLAVAWGRVDPGEAPLQVEGDVALGRRILANLNVMP